MAERAVDERSYGKREAPFSLRLSFEERTKVEANAGNMPVAAYIKSLLFADDAPRYQSRSKEPVKDRQALAQVLACLGASRLSSNLNQLAHSTHVATFYFDEDTKLAILGACNDVRVMRQLLMTALGLQVEESRERESVAQSFTCATVPQPQVEMMREAP
jgi:hypothetical protein